MANLSPVYNENQFDNQGNLLVGGMIYSYVAGSSTPLATYTSSDGSTPQTNPIVLNARGEVDSPIWLTSGLAYKLRLLDSQNNFMSEFDNVVGVGDAALTADQWVPSDLTPTYISSTQFTAPGDQTSALAIGRRIRLNVTAGTVYGYITSSVYNGSTLTTVTVFLDSGSIDNGVDSIQLGLLTPDNPSYPAFSDKSFRWMDDLDQTKIAQVQLAGITTGTTRTLTFQDKNITVAGIDDINGGAQLGSKIQPVVASVATNTLTVTLNQTVLDFRNPTLTSGTSNTVNISTTSLTVPSGATLGTVNAVQSRIVILAIYNGGSHALGVVNLSGGIQLDETNLITTTAISASANSANVIYSQTAISTPSPYRVVGFVDITEATAGTWATAPSLVQGLGGQPLNSLSSFGFTSSSANLAGSRTSGVTYRNTTNKPMKITYISVNNVSPQAVTIAIAGISYSAAVAANNSLVITDFVGPGETYSYTTTAGAISAWYER